MNKRMRYCLTGFPALFLLAGCFGGNVQTPRPDTQLQAELSLRKGIRAEQRGDTLDAEQLLIKSLAISSSIEDYPARVTALVNLARLSRLRHELSKAVIYIDQALVLTKTDPRHFAEVAYEKALVDLAGNNPATALEWAQKAISEERGDKLGSRLNLAARIQLLLSRWSEARVLARKAREENRSSGQVEEEANSLRIMGIVARNERDYAAATRLFQEALQLDRQLGKSGKISADLRELAETARCNGQLRETASYLERVYEVDLAGGRLQQAVDTQEKLAGVYTAMGEEHNAARARQTAQNLAQRNVTQKPGSSSATINPSSSP